MAGRITTPGANSRLRILVLGYLVRGPLGGLAWHHLQYIMGLQRLGHEVCFLEDSNDYAACYNPQTHSVGTDPGYGLDFTRAAFETLGLGESWAYYDAHSNSWMGALGDKALERCKEADVLLNVSAVNPIRPWLEHVPARILIDTDPVFTQLRHLQDPIARNQADMHNVFLSFGENIGRENCGIPADGFPWMTTRQPVVLEAWPVEPAPANGRFTTVMQWDSYQSRRYKDKEYGMKSKSFSPYMDLPRHTRQSLEMALGSDSAPREELLGLGWSLRDPLEVTVDPWEYQRYIRASKGEFSVAKHGYVVSNSGWFSERSAAYMASGRPVIVQDTGFSDWLQCGSGVMAFGSPEDAAAALEAVNTDYASHCRAAREIATSYFDSRRVLQAVIEYANELL